MGCVMKQLLYGGSFLLIFWMFMNGCNSVVGVDEDDLAVPEAPNQSQTMNSFAETKVQYTVLDSFDSEGTPALKGDVKTDGENLVLIVHADPMAISGDNANIGWMVHTGDSEPVELNDNWMGSYFLLDEGSFANGTTNDSFLKWGVGTTGVGGGGNPSQERNYADELPNGVMVEYEAMGDVGIWKMTIPYHVIDVKDGDTISYVVGAVYQDAETDSQSRNFSHGGDVFVYANSTLFQKVTLEHNPVAEDPNPETREDCKKSGWEAFDFQNQGQCVRFVNTGQDSR